MICGGTTAEILQKVFLEKGNAVFGGRGRFEIMDQVSRQEFEEGHYPTDKFCLTDAKDRLETAGEEFDGKEVVGRVVVTDSRGVAQHEDIAVGRDVVSVKTGRQLVGRTEIDPEGGGPAGEHFNAEGAAGGEAGGSLWRGFREKFDKGAEGFAGFVEVVYLTDVIEDLNHGQIYLFLPNRVGREQVNFFHAGRFICRGEWVRG